MESILSNNQIQNIQNLQGERERKKEAIHILTSKFVSSY